MLIHRKRNNLLNVHRDAARRCCWDSGLMLNITPIGKMVSVKCLSKLEEVFERGRFELHESPQCLLSIYSFMTCPDFQT